MYILKHYLITMRFSVAPVEKLLIHKKVQFQFQQCEKRKYKSKQNLITKAKWQKFYWHHNTSGKILCMFTALSKGKEGIFTKYVPTFKEQSEKKSTGHVNQIFILNYSLNY